MELLSRVQGMFALTLKGTENPSLTKMARFVSYTKHLRLALLQPHPGVHFRLGASAREGPESFLHSYARQRSRRNSLVEQKAGRLAVWECWLKVAAESGRGGLERQKH